MCGWGDVPRGIARSLRLGQGGGAFVNPLLRPLIGSDPRAVSFSRHALPHAVAVSMLEAARWRFGLRAFGGATTASGSSAAYFFKLSTTSKVRVPRLTAFTSPA